MGTVNFRQKTNTGVTTDCNLTKNHTLPAAKCDKCDRLPPLFTLYLVKREKKKEREEEEFRR